MPDHLYDDGKVKSNAYKRGGKPDPSISVDLAKLTTLEESIARGRRADTLAGVLTLKEIKALGLTVRHNPTDENPSHVLIEGNTTRAMCDDLAKITQVVRPKPG